MDIESYCLPDWPSTSNQLIPPILKNQSKSAKSPRHVSISSKRDSNISEFLQLSEREQLIRTLSARKPQDNLLTNTIKHFIPRSTSGKTMKQQIVTKQKSSSKALPAIKSQLFPPPVLTISPPDENATSRVNSNVFELPFACPSLIRQRLIQDGPVSTILYDTCSCRAEHVPTIHDLEFDSFIQLTNHLNARQLIVIGIINSNLHQIDNQQANDLHEILQTLHYHLNYGRSQICSCRLSTNDEYRCLIYDLANATKQSSLLGPILVRRHHVQPGFILIYQHGQLIFGDSTFNGYGKDIQDLQKQLNHMTKHVQQIALPEAFKFL